MISGSQVTTEIEWIVDHGMGTQKSLSLPDRLEFSHSSLPHPGWLMRLLNPVIRIPVIYMHGVRDHRPTGNAIATQFVGHDLPRLTIVVSYEPSEEALGSSAISASLKEHINYILVLIDRPPQIMLLAIDLHEDFINVEGVAVTVMSAFQSTGVLGRKLDTGPAP